SRRGDLVIPQAVPLAQALIPLEQCRAITAEAGDRHGDQRQQQSRSGRAARRDDGSAALVHEQGLYQKTSRKRERRNSRSVAHASGSSRGHHFPPAVVKRWVTAFQLTTFHQAST